jgi:hypothetical protein
MKIKFILAASALAWCASLDAATLSVSTAVQSQPDPSSPVIAILKAGSDEPMPTDKVGPPPPGWTAVDVRGPFEGYVRNKDLTKELDVHPGATVYLGPKDTSGVLTTFEAGDKAEITGLRGGWTQVRLDKTLVGYIQANPTVVPSVPEVAPSSPAPAAPASAPAAMPSTAPAGTGGDQSVALSRLYEGTLSSTRTILMPKRPYEWQLVDASGKRIAYVDLTRLLLTDQIENYNGHPVVVLGSLKSVQDGKDLVIDADGLRLK